MAANTEMSRLDSLPTETLNSLIALAESFPTSIKNPSDGDTIVYDATSKKWKNGEGGGGSGADIMLIRVTEDATGSVECDHTYEEIAAAVEAGQFIMVHSAKEGLAARTDVFVAKGYFIGDFAVLDGLSTNATEEDGIVSIMAVSVSISQESIFLSTQEHPFAE